MKKWIISLTCIICASTGIYAQTTSGTADRNDTTTVSLSRYEKHIKKGFKLWNNLRPNQTKIQFAGSIGAFSIGAGRHYGKRQQWETDLMIGYLPKAESDESHWIFTIKQSYVPFHCDLGRRFELEPLACGLFLSTISGEQFWKRQPSKYPKHYYGFSTAIRANLFIGQRICYKIPHSARRYHRNISFYYELSTCDLYLVSKFTNSQLSVWDILSLAIGLKLDIF